MPRQFQTKGQRQERVLAKIGLMPLTSTPKIQKRFGLSERSIQEARSKESRLSNHAKRIELVQRFKKKRDTRYLLDTPTLWQFARIVELAPLFTGKEIHHILVREKAQHPRTNAILSASVVSDLMTRFRLHTQEQSREKSRKMSLTRRPNLLLQKEKKQLREWAMQFYQKRNLERKKETYRELLRDYFVKRAIADIDFVKLDQKTSPEKMKATWFAYLARATRFYELKFFTLQRAKKKKEERENAINAINGWEKNGITFSPRERTFVIETMVGTDPSKIAGRLRIPIARLVEIRNTIAEKLGRLRSA